jgi:hypothetical protein
MDDQQEAVETNLARGKGTSTHVFNDIHVWRSRIPLGKEAFEDIEFLGGRLNIYMAFATGISCVN